MIRKIGRWKKKQITRKVCKRVDSQGQEQKPCEWQGKGVEHFQLALLSTKDDHEEKAN